jgi:hypothetical protein
MKVEVSAGIEELKRQFNNSSFSVREDGQGGAYVLMEPVILGPKFCPAATWIGFQIPAQYPYTDIYPLFIGEELVRADGAAFVAPVTRGHHFEGRPAIQVSRRNSAAQSGLQRVSAKVLKVLDYLEKLP